MEKKTTPAQRKASDKWDSKNKEKVAYIKKRSAARKFTEIAEMEDVDDLIDRLLQRKEELENNKWD